MFCSMISEGTDGVTFLSMMRHKVMLEDRKSTRLNSSHLVISYAVFCLKKKKKTYDKTFARILARFAVMSSRAAFRIALTTLNHAPISSLAPARLSTKQFHCTRVQSSSF